MKKSTIVYEEKRILNVKFNHPKSEDYLTYLSIIKIKDSGKNPIEMEIKFNGIYPFGPSMPPEEHIFKAESVLGLFSEVIKWFAKFGYKVL